MACTEHQTTSKSRSSYKLGQNISVVLLYQDAATTNLLTLSTTLLKALAVDPW